MIIAASSPYSPFLRPVDRVVVVAPWVAVE